MRTIIVCLASILCGWTICNMTVDHDNDAQASTKDDKIQLGNFSISLTVKDVHASKAFYEKTGFKVSGGDLKRNYVIMQNETSTIGLYQGMFPKNSLTYNPGWDRNCQTLPEFQDVREIQKELKKRGLTLTVEADEASKGTAFYHADGPRWQSHIDRPACPPTQLISGRPQT